MVVSIISNVKTPGYFSSVVDLVRVVILYLYIVHLLKPSDRFYNDSIISSYMNQVSIPSNLSYINFFFSVHLLKIST